MVLVDESNYVNESIQLIIIKFGISLSLLSEHTPKEPLSAHLQTSDPHLCYRLFSHKWRQLEVRIQRKRR